MICPEAMMCRVDSIREVASRGVDATAKESIRDREQVAFTPDHCLSYCLINAETKRVNRIVHSPAKCDKWITGFVCLLRNSIVAVKARTVRELSFLN